MTCKGKNSNTFLAATSQTETNELKTKQGVVENVYLNYLCINKGGLDADTQFQGTHALHGDVCRQSLNLAVQLP